MTKGQHNVYQVKISKSKQILTGANRLKIALQIRGSTIFTNVITDPGENQMGQGAKFGRYAGSYCDGHDHWLLP